MNTLTEELFRYSIITSTAEDLRFDMVSLNDILEQSLSGSYGVLSKRGITPDIRMPEKPVMRKLDKNALRRVFDNILNNAAKYSDGDLTVTLDADGTIRFSNAAENLSCVQTEKLFDRFFTVETAKGSTGLGLSIAKLLTERMGGTIGVDYQNHRLSVFVCFRD